MGDIKVAGEIVYRTAEETPGLWRVYTRDGSLACTKRFNSASEAGRWAREATGYVVDVIDAGKSD